MTDDDQCLCGYVPETSADWIAHLAEHIAAQAARPKTVLRTQPMRVIVDGQRIVVDLDAVEGET